MKTRVKTAHSHFRVVSRWREGSTVCHVTDRSPSGASWASTPAVRRSMQANRGRDTRPEMAIRKRVHAAGLRYRVSERPIPELRRTADLVFRRDRIAVFCDGCFWHGCPEHGELPTRNRAFWAEKLARNVARDRQTDSVLVAQGWTVLRVWEHDDADEAAERIVEAVMTVRTSG